MYAVDPSTAIELTVPSTPGHGSGRDDRSAAASDGEASTAHTTSPNRSSFLTAVPRSTIRVPGGPNTQEPGPSCSASRLGHPNRGQTPIRVAEQGSDPH